MCDTKIPITLAAAELNVSIYDLKRRANGQLCRDDAGIACLPRELVRQLIDERDAEIQADQARRRAAAAEVEARAVTEREFRRRRRAALREKHAELQEAGLDALTIITAERQEARWNESAIDTHEMRG